ncbi:cytochrome P450 93G1-like [Carex rostrata]
MANIQSPLNFSFSLPLLTIAFSTLSLIVFLLNQRLKSRHLPPSPPALPVIGHLHLLKPPIHRALDRLTTTYGPLLHLRFGSTLCIVASTADLARDFLKTHDAVFTNRPSTAASRQFAYDDFGFAFAPFGPYWRFMKRLCMSELLGSQTVTELRPVRNAELRSMLKSIMDKAQQNEAVNLSKEIIKLTNNEVTKMAASTAIRSETAEARELVKQVAEIIGSFNLEDFIGICRGMDLQGLGKRMRDVHSRFDRLLEGIMRGKEEEKRQGKKRDMKDLIDILLEVAADDKAEIKLSRENIKGFIMDLFTAGTDSSAATIEWALAELINHPDALQKLRDELDSVVGKDRLVEETDLPNLPYLNAAMKEAMRLHPAATISHRQSIKEVTVNGYTIPADTSLFVNLWSVNRDPKYWVDPNEFKPERFLEGPTAGLDVRGLNFQLLPFGSGRRGCPGMTLAMQAVPVAVAALVQCFDWNVKGKVDMEEGIGLVSARARQLILPVVPRLQPFPATEAA